MRRYGKKVYVRQSLGKNIELDWDAVPDNWDSSRKKLKFIKLLSKYGIRKIVKVKILGLS